MKRVNYISGVRPQYGMTSNNPWVIQYLLEHKKYLASCGILTFYLSVATNYYAKAQELQSF